jgi:nicotinate dehydrogenase subunit A
MTDTRLTLTINGTAFEAKARPGLSLLGYVRTQLGLTGAKSGCGTGDCGACTMLVNGTAMQACQLSLSAVDGAEVRTIEAIITEEPGASVAAALIREGAAQCGYCLPGIVAAASAALARDGAHTDLSKALEGNLCRCGTHHRILSALTRVRDALPGTAP